MNENDNIVDKIKMIVIPTVIFRGWRLKRGNTYE